MKRKKKCQNCGKRIERDFEYCPYCGYKQKKADGLLDEIEDLMKPKAIDLGFGGLFGSFNKIIENLVKQMEEEIKKIDKEIKPIEPNKLKRSPGISIRINFSGGTPKITIREGKKEKEIEEIKERKIRKIKDIDLKKLEKLPREEAKTKIKRLSNAIIYEISLPGVKKLDDIEIRKLENSIEIKAIGKDKIYFKLIPIALPILKYELKKEKLYIYFKPEI